MARSKTPDHLPIHMLLQMANAACALYGFEKLAGMELKHMYTTKQVQPAIIRQNENGMLWVDKWYVAIQLGNNDVKYLYLTRHHICEEEFAYRLLATKREHPLQLPADIQKEFRIASAWMLPTERSLYFSLEAEQLGLCWVRDWRIAVRKELRQIKINANTKRSA